MGIITEIKVLMLRAGINNKQLAERSGLTESQVSKIISGKQELTWEHIQLFATACKVKINITFTQI